MKFYKCVNEVKPSYVVETEPQFSETVLYQNQGTAIENEITLSNDYHNYDIIKIVCCDTASNDTLFPSYATPGILDYLVTDNNPYVNCNMIDTNHYIVYQINSGTLLTYQSGSNVYVTQIIGLKCTNGTITEAEIFSRQRSNSWTEINTELNLFEFNMILTLTSTGAAHECVINNLVFMKPIGNNTYYGSTDINNQLNIWRVMYYGNSVFAGLTNHYISPCLWYYVTGLKFIPKWDYYIENIEFSGASGQQILHLPMTFSIGNENYILKSKMYFSSDHATTAHGYSYFVSAWDGSSNMIACDGATGSISIYPTGGRELISMNGIKDRWIDIEINQAQNYAKIDGVIYNNTWRNPSSQFYIRGGNTGASTPVFYGETQIYRNGILIANYIPSVKANGIGYFYDTISQTDKVSEGNSSFGYACF